MAAISAATPTRSTRPTSGRPPRVGPVGFGNYVGLFNDKIFLQSVANTFYFVLLTTPAFVAIGLVLALALNNMLNRLDAEARASAGAMPGGAS